jgi:hypothetical protein
MTGDVGAAQYHLPFSKSLMFVAGYFCSLFFFAIYYFYIAEFTAHIWNHYFADYHSTALLGFLIFVVQIADYVVIILAPHFWYLSVASAYVIYLLIIARLYNSYYRRFKHQNIYLEPDDLPGFVINVKKAFGDQAPSLLARFVLARFCLQRFVYFGMFFGSPFIAVMAISQFMRHRIGDLDLEFVQAGTYVTAAVLFTFLFGFYLILRLTVMNRGKERIDALDYGYFLNIVR